MPEISRFFGIVITMYHGDHDPPHFHARYGAFQAEIDIRDGVIRNGRLPNRALALVREWATLHRDELAANWGRARQMVELNAVEPLD